MENNKPYNFDEKYEYKTYQKIGRDYEEVQSLSKVEEDRGTYMIYHTYSQWEIHILNFLQGMRNFDDFLHWIMGKRNFWSCCLEVIKIAYIPVYICGISLIGNESNKYITFLMVFLYTAFILLFAWIAINCVGQRIHYYDDIIKICEKINKKNIENK